VPIRHEFPNYEQRRSEATLPEALLWRKLRNSTAAGKKFRRQQQIGSYIADFYCSTAGLIIEVDGGQHLESEAQAYDQARTAYFASRGLKILRFTNLEVLKEMDGVIEAILEAIGAPSP
jgi:very-short-patch-repair endonuclease